MTLRNPAGGHRVGDLDLSGVSVAGRKLRGGLDPRTRQQKDRAVQVVALRATGVYAPSAGHDSILPAFFVFGAVPFMMMPFFVLTRNKNDFKNILWDIVGELLKRDFPTNKTQRFETSRYCLLQGAGLWFAGLFCKRLV